MNRRNFNRILVLGAASIGDILWYQHSKREAEQQRITTTASPEGPQTRDSYGVIRSSEQWKSHAVRDLLYLQKHPHWKNKGPYRICYDPRRSYHVVGGLEEEVGNKGIVKNPYSGLDALLFESKNYLEAIMAVSKLSAMIRSDEALFGLLQTDVLKVVKNDSEYQVVIDLNTSHFEDIKTILERHFERITQVPSQPKKYFEWESEATSGWKNIKREVEVLDLINQVADNHFKEMSWQRRLLHLAQIKHESHNGNGILYNKWLRSNKGAFNLMQITYRGFKESTQHLNSYTWRQVITDCLANIHIGLAHYYQRRDRLAKDLVPPQLGSKALEVILDELAMLSYVGNVDDVMAFYRYCEEFQKDPFGYIRSLEKNPGKIKPGITDDNLAQWIAYSKKIPMYHDEMLWRYGRNLELAPPQPEPIQTD